MTEKCQTYGCSYLGVEPPETCPDRPCCSCIAGTVLPGHEADAVPVEDGCCLIPAELETAKRND